MRLTDYEKAMLDGEHGEMRQQAMQALCDLARFYDVEEFVEVVGCHDDSTVYAGEAQVAFAEHLADNGAKFAVPTTTNATACDINLWDRQKHDVETMAATRRIEAAHVKMGAIPTWSCAPYHIGVAPSFGQQFASAITIQSSEPAPTVTRVRWNCSAALPDAFLTSACMYRRTGMRRGL